MFVITRLKPKECRGNSSGEATVAGLQKQGFVHEVKKFCVRSQGQAAKDSKGMVLEVKFFAP